MTCGESLPLLPKTCACRNRGFFRLLDGKVPCASCRPRAYKAAVRGAQFTGDPAGTAGPENALAGRSRSGMNGLEAQGS